MDRGELIENLRTTLLWETVCAHVERTNEANVLLRKRRQDSWIYRILRAIRMIQYSAD